MSVIFSIFNLDIIGYLYGNNDQICMGCTDDYFALSLRYNLLDGYSKETRKLNVKSKFSFFKEKLR